MKYVYVCKRTTKSKSTVATIGFKACGE